MVDIGNIDDGQPPKLDERARIEIRKRQLAAEAALTAAPDFDPNLHPRGFDGRFIEVLGFVDLINPSEPDRLGQRGQVVKIVPNPKTPGAPDITVRLARGNGKYHDVVAKPSYVRSAPTPKARLPKPEERGHETRFPVQPDPTPGFTAPEMGSARPNAEGAITIEPADLQVENPRPGMGDHSPMRPMRLGVDSLAAYMDPETGRISEERQRLHDEIVGRFLDGIPPSDDPTFTLMGGGPAAGKSEILKQGGIDVPAEGDAAFIDSDKIKAMLPESETMDKEGDGRWAMFLHEESSYLAKRVIAAAMERSQDVVYDATGDSHVSSVRDRIQRARDNGYKVNGRYVTVDTNEAVRRAKKRGEETGRVVPEHVVRGTHIGVSKVWPQLEDHFDDVQLWDTSTRTPKMIYHDTNTTDPEIFDQPAYDAFLAKAKESAASAITPGAPLAPAPVPAAGSESGVASEDLTRMTADITVGVPKAESLIPLDGDAAAAWDDISAEVAALDRKMVVESPHEVPDLTEELEMMQ